MRYWKKAGLLVVVLGLAAPAAADAQVVPKKKNVSPFASQIKTLHATHALLAQADHDYKGHRVKAMHDIHKAVVALRGPQAKKKKPGTGVKPPVTNPQAGKLPQDQSNALLRQALQQVQAVVNQLAGVQDPRVVQALPALQDAIQELQIALQVNKE
jgi:hypothetical protein